MLPLPLPEPSSEPEPGPGGRRSGVARLERAGSVALHLLILAAATWVAVLVLARLRLVVLPLLLALAIATVLAPAVARLRSAGLRPALATTLVLGTALGLFAGAGFAVVPPIAAQMGDVGEQAQAGLEQAERWLANRFEAWPEDLSLADEISAWADRNSAAITQGVASGALILLEVLAGLVLAVVVLFFLLKDGERLSAKALELAPAERRPKLSAVARRSWQTLGGYVRGAAINGMVEAVMVAIALALLGIPLVLPLAALTFFAGFLPVVGAVVVGTIAALIALVAGGVGDALLVSGVFTLVQQVQNNLLEPLILGRSVRLHPLAVLLSITAGAVVAGIIGALLAVPVVAVAVSALSEARNPEPAVPAEEG